MRRKPNFDEAVVDMTRREVIFCGAASFGLASLGRSATAIASTPMAKPTGQAPVIFRAGDCFIMKPGYTGTWRTIQTARKVWGTA